MDMLSGKIDLTDPNQIALFAALAGLVGAVIGGLIGFVGTRYSTRKQIQRQERDARQATYAEFLTRLHRWELSDIDVAGSLEAFTKQINELPKTEGWEDTPATPKMQEAVTTIEGQYTAMWVATNETSVAYMNVMLVGPHAVSTAARLCLGLTLNQSKHALLDDARGLAFVFMLELMRADIHAAGSKSYWRTSWEAKRGLEVLDKFYKGLPKVVSGDEGQEPEQPA